MKWWRTLGLFVHYKSTAHAVESLVKFLVRAIYSLRRLPEVLIRCEQVTIFAENREPHAIRVSFEHLIPAPEHVSIHVIMHMMLPIEHERFVFQDRRIP